MAKRMTDTEKWKKDWFRKLPAIDKCAWVFLCDQCDHAGVWDISEDSLQHFLGEPYSVAKILATFGDRVQLVGDDKLFIPGFALFQYGHLNPQNRVHNSVLDRLSKLKIKPLASPLLGAKDKDTDKETDKDKDRRYGFSNDWPIGSKDRALGGLSVKDAVAKIIQLKNEGAS